MAFKNIKLSTHCNLYVIELLEEEKLLEERRMRVSNLKYKNIYAFFEKIEYNKKLIKNYNHIKNLNHYIINHHLDYNILEYLKPKTNGGKEKETNLKLCCEGCGVCYLGNKNYETHYYCNSCDFYVCYDCLNDDERLFIESCACGCINFCMCMFYPQTLAYHAIKNERIMNEYKNYCNGAVQKKKYIIDELLSGHYHPFNCKVTEIILKDETQTKKERKKIMTLHNEYGHNIKKIIGSGLTDYFDME